MGFSGEGWTPEKDVYAFTLILFQIVSGCRAVEIDLAACRYDIPPCVSSFVSEMIVTGLSPRREKKRSIRDIFDVLRKHNFRILPGVDTEDVSAFVRGVETLEQLGE